MKKYFLTLILILGTLLSITGCNSGKISELEKEIEEINFEIQEKRNDLAEWQELYNDARKIYTAPHSNNSEVQAELQRTKEIMDEAQAEVNALQREIDLLKYSKEYKEEELKELKD